MLLNKIKKYYFQKKNIRIGSNTRILTSLSNFGSEPYLVKIGSNCTITSGVKFITHDASIGIVLQAVGKARIIDNSKYEIMAPIIIKDNCMLGVNSIILPGVSVGPNSIVGAGAIVTKNVPPGVVVAGNPAQFICSIEDYYNKAESKMFMIPIVPSLEKRKDLIMNKFKNLI